MRLFRYPGYAKFWTSDTISTFGTHITAVALPALAMFTMDASNTEYGLLTAARWLPYLLFGLLAGVIADRYRRRPILVATDFGRAALLTLIALLALTGALNIYALMGFVMVFGALSLLYDASHQSYLPSLVPVQALTAANARMEQSGAVAQTTGPFLGGSVVAIVGAPLGLAVDAFSYLVSGVLLLSIRRDEPAPVAQHRDLKKEVREGLSWVYKHPMLAPYALTLHARFLFGSLLATVFVLFVTRGLQPGLSDKDAAFALGLVLAIGGLGAVAGNSIAVWAERRFGAGPTVIAERALEPLGWLPAALAVTGWSGWVMVGLAQFLVWFALGLSGPSEMGYRQSVTPDHLQGRMNATIRSMNWGLVTVGATAGGLLVDHAGFRLGFWIGIIGLSISAVVIAMSPYRHARIIAEAPLEGSLPSPR